LIYIKDPSFDFTISTVRKCLYIWAMAFLLKNIFLGYGYSY